MKNPWGDPWLQHYPVCQTAVWAFVVSMVALACTMLLYLGHSGADGRPIFGVLGAVLLASLQVAATMIALTLAYVALLTCPIEDPRPGRGLAWSALACSFLSAICIIAVLTTLLPIFRVAQFLVIGIAVLHVLAFAAESTFARYLVTCSIIGAMFFSLLSCAMLQSREQARRLQCQKNLQEIGLQLSSVMETQNQVQDFQAVQNFQAEDASRLQPFVHPALAPSDFAESWRADWTLPAIDSGSGQQP